MTLADTINFWVTQSLGEDPAVRWRNFATDLLHFPETARAAQMALDMLDEASLQLGMSASPAAIPAQSGDGGADAEGQVLLIRTTLRLQPFHSTVAAVRVLYEQGRDAFKAMRGPV